MLHSKIAPVIKYLILFERVQTWKIQLPKILKTIEHRQEWQILVQPGHK